MMPVRMSLVMDQRRLPNLLVECANANMPIEVKRICIHKSEGNVLNFAPAAGTTGPGMVGPTGGGLGGPAAMPGFDGGNRTIGAATDKQESGTLDVPVEIYGVIYIYNPPDRDKLGGRSAEKPAEGAVSGAESQAHGRPVT